MTTSTSEDLLGPPRPAHRAERRPRPAGRNHRDRLGLALAVISAAQLMVVLDATIANIALPSIQTSLGFSDANLSWVINAYTLAFGGLLLLGGRAGDLLGRRAVFITGVLLFTAASLAGGVSQDSAMLIVARIVQGVGAAIASPTALSLITTTFPAGPARNRAFAVYAAMSGAGAAIGLILGGVLTEISWRWTFLINVPIGIAVALLAPMFLHESERVRGRFDLPGAVTGTIGLVGLVYGLTHAATSGWGDPLTLTYLAAGVGLLAVFLVIESRSPHALMPFRVLAQRSRLASYVAMLVVGAGMFAMFYFLSLYIQQVLGYSPVKAGVSFLPFSVGIVVSAQLASWLVNRVDPRWISGTGALIAGSGMYWLTSLTVSSGYLTHLLGPILVISFGLGFVFVPLTLTAVAGVQKADSGVASAVLNTMQQVGGAVGLATLSTVFTNALTSRSSELAAGVQAKVASGALSAEQAKAMAPLLRGESFVAGASAAYLTAAVMVVVAAVVVFTFLTVRHQDLNSDPGAVVVH